MSFFGKLLEILDKIDTGSVKMHEEVCPDCGRIRDKGEKNE